MPCPDCGSENIDWEYDAEFGIRSGICNDCGCEFYVEEIMNVTKHGETEEER